MSDTREDLAGALVGLPARSRRLGAETLQRVVEWADLNLPECQRDRTWTGAGREVQIDTVTDTVDGRPCCRCQDRTRVEWRRGRRQCCWPGNDGTPAVSVSAVAELGVFLETTTTSASILLGDALDLRHRHPRLWARVQAAEVADWQARKVARLSAELSWEQARQVDDAVADLIGDLPWGRALIAVEAAVQKTDPELHELRRQAAERRRYVSAGRYRGTNSFGMRTMVAQGPVGDIARVDALLDFLASLLKHHGDPDPLQVRRSKAFGLLANPALVCRLLAAARDAANTQAAGAEADGHAESAVPDADSDCVNDLGDDCAGDSVVAAAPASTCDSSRDEDSHAPPPDPQESSAPSAVELAEVFGRVLAGYRGGEVWRRLRPTTSLVLHLSDATLARAPACTECGAVGDESGVVRLEDTHGPLGPISLAQLRDLLDDQLPDQLARLLRTAGNARHETGATPATTDAGHGTDPPGGPPDDLALRDQIVVRPVLDPLGQAPVDAYESPPDMREAVGMTAPFEIFPWGTAPSSSCDLDHTDPYVRQPDGEPPPGQTRPGNLGPLSRRHHNLKTHHGWRCFQPLPGLFLWLTPSGYWFRIDHLGTTPLGKDEPEIIRQRRRAAPSRLESYLSNLLVQVA